MVKTGTSSKVFMGAISTPLTDALKKENPSEAASATHNQRSRSSTYEKCIRNITDRYFQEFYYKNDIYIVIQLWGHPKTMLT